MPKKTRLQKLKNQTKKEEIKDDSFFAPDPAFKKDMMKSILFALLITGFEIALYFVYYQHLFERR